MTDTQFHPGKSSERSHILDLGCGSGNHLAHLNALFPGKSFTGVDISKEMTGLAKLKEKQGNFHWNLIEGDFLDIYLPIQKFQFIYSIGNSFLLMIQNRALSVILSKIEQILTSKGMFFFQILNNSNPRSGYVASPLFHTEEGDAFHTLKRFSPDREKKLMHVDFLEYFQGHDQSKPEISVNSTFWPLVTLKDMQKVVKDNSKLKILNTWANYKKETYYPKTSNNLLILFQKA
ncbi:MAG: class I SAM-dependent methyltransferase [Promethearchaeota archaeon]